MSAIPRPAQRIAGLDHRAGQIPGARSRAEGRGALALGIAARDAREARPVDGDVASRADAPWTAEQPHEIVTRLKPRRLRARMTRPARPVNLSRGYAFQPHARAFGAPYRPVTIPHRYSRAGEARSRRDNGNPGSNAIPAAAIEQQEASQRRRSDPDRSSDVQAQCLFPFEIGDARPQRVLVELDPVRHKRRAEGFHGFRCNRFPRLKLGDGAGADPRGPA
jgi:hypothetical protein